SEATTRAGGTPVSARSRRWSPARACDSRRFENFVPVLSVYPATSIRISGFATSDAATASSTKYESRVSTDRPVSKFTPLRISVGRGAGAPGAVGRAGSGANSTRQPFASTWLPGGAGGHLAGAAACAVGALTASTGSGQPVASTLVPAGVLGHWSMPSGTPSRSASRGQPLASTVAPLGVLGHLSRPSGTPSPSASMGQPLGSTATPAGVAGH